MPPMIIDAPERPPVSRSRYRRWTWRRQLAASGLRLGVLALLAGFAWGGWYLANKGFGRQWRLTVVEELRKRGVEASVHRLTLDPFRGLVAQDLRIFDSNDRDNLLAVISEVSLDINYAALLHHQPFLNALDVRGADVTFQNPRGDPKAPKAQLKQFRAHVYFPPDQIYISQAEGLFCGIRVSATGQLIKRSDFQPAGKMTDAEWSRRMELLQRVAIELGKFDFAGGPPSLQVKFSGDVEQIELVQIEAVLRGENVQRGGYEMKTLAVSAEWRDRQLTINECSWSDEHGEFAARASWNTASHAADFQAHSSADARQFLEAFGFGKFLAQATFAKPPTLELSGSANFAGATPRLSVIGRVAAANFTYKTVPVASLAGDFSWDGERTMLRDVRMRHETGEVLADLLDSPDDFRLNVQSTIDPTAIAAVAPPELRRFLGEWEWPRTPTVRMQIRGPSRDPQTWSGEGHVTLQRTRFRGVWMNNASADVRFGGGALTFDHLKVTRDEGVGTGAFTYDFKQHEVRVDNVVSTLRPADAIYWVEPKLHKAVIPYKFRSPPHLTVNGVVQFHGGKNSHLEIGVDAPAGMDYVFLGKTLPFETVRGQLLFTEGRLQLSDVEAALFDGTTRGTADISLAKDDRRHTASVAVDGIDFPRLTDLYFKYKTARGQLSGTYDFQGIGGDARTMLGNGKIKVGNGNVFAIPVFGPLSGLISGIFPGAGYSVATQATAGFTTRDGVIHTDDFKVSGKLFGMVGHGDIHFLDNKLDFDIRISASGAGLVLTPMYKLFEYKGEGSLSKPNWHPKRF
ncbi:MAG TPA: AsmA-like C-terminal region-containing protein [Chthoniobacterales bacterium]|nr:AsmA-like C-terminal region-containing protein [Chthoniobacterales bacterium]